MKDKIYITGLTLMVISFLACVVSYYLFIFGIPVFIIGTILVFISKRQLRIKLFTTILPIIFYLPSTYIFLRVYNYTSPKTFLIPSDYEGPIRIVYEEKCGVTLHKENGREVLQFPESGILILNEKFNGGVNNEYYLIDKNGNRKKIEQRIDYKNKTKILPYILVSGAGTLGAGGKEEITFTEFYLCNKDTTLLDDYKLSVRFDSITTEIVKRCRMK